jgi:hypothetical protein
LIETTDLICDVVTYIVTIKHPRTYAVVRIKTFQCTHSTSYFGTHHYTRAQTHPISERLLNTGSRNSSLYRAVKPVYLEKFSNQAWLQDLWSGCVLLHSKYHIAFHVKKFAMHDMDPNVVKTNLQSLFRRRS